MRTLPKIIFIDWHNTLSNYKFFWNLQKSKSKFDNDNYVKISKYLFNNNPIQLDKWLRGQFTTEKILHKASKKCGLDYDYIFLNFVKSCKSMKLMSPHIPKVITNIKKGGVKFFISTDNMDSFNRWTVPALKLDKLFDGIQNSFDLKVLKSDFNKNGDSLFFNKILRSENIKASESIIIDDHKDVDNKFKKLGFRYLRVTNKNRLIDIISKISQKLPLGT